VTAIDILAKSAIESLSNPLVHDRLLPTMLRFLDPVLARDPSTWKMQDRKDVAQAFTWAMWNLK
jgi:hypothetical protein